MSSRSFLEQPPLIIIGRSMPANRFKFTMSASTKCNLLKLECSNWNALKCISNSAFAFWQLYICHQHNPPFIIINITISEFCWCMTHYILGQCNLAVLSLKIITIIVSAIIIIQFPFYSMKYQMCVKAVSKSNFTRNELVTMSADVCQFNKNIWQSSEVKSLL